MYWNLQPPLLHLIPTLNKGLSCLHGHGRCQECSQIRYSGLFSWVEIFVKSWKRPSELNFVVLNFVARIQRNVNFELGTRDAVSARNA